MEAHQAEGTAQAGKSRAYPGLSGVQGRHAEGMENVAMSRGAALSRKEKLCLQKRRDLLGCVL